MADKPEIDPITYCSPAETESVAGGWPDSWPPERPPVPPPPSRPRPRETGGEDLRPW